MSTDGAEPTAGPLKSPDVLAGQAITIRRGVNLQVSYHPGQEPTLVFLHGGLGNRYNWRSQYEYFAQQGRSLLAYDLAGHGQSLPYSRYSLGRHRRDFTRLLQKFEIVAPILCCHSYGVPLGLEWASQYSASALVLIAGGTHDLTPWWEVPVMKSMGWVGRHLYRFSTMQQWARDMMTRQTRDEIQRFWEECPVPTQAEPYKAIEIFWNYDFFERHSFNAIGQTPALIISGGQDPMFCYEMGSDLQQRFAHGEHLHLPDAGHLAIAEYPEAVNQAITHLIAQI